MNDSEILNLIKKSWGISIYLGKNIDGGDYWSVSGGDINAGGYSTLDEAIQIWAKTQKKYNKKREDNFEK